MKVLMCVIYIKYKVVQNSMGHMKVTGNFKLDPETGYSLLCLQEQRLHCFQRYSDTDQPTIVT